jgi:hypothetical protein
METTNREEIPFLSLFTTEKVKFGTDYKISETNNSALVKRIESSLLKDLESKTAGGGSSFNYDMIFGDFSQPVTSNFTNNMSKELLDSR